MQCTVRQPTGACLIRDRSKRRSGFGPNQKGKIRGGCRIIQRVELKYDYIQEAIGERR